MLKLVSYLVNSLVDNPEAVVVEELIDESGTHQITISVDQADMGKIIGKGGKTINSLRELAKVKAIKTGQRVRLSLKDQFETDPLSQSQLSVEPSEIE